MENRITPKNSGNEKKVVEPSQQTIQVIKDFARSYYAGSSNPIKIGCCLN